MKFQTRKRFSCRLMRIVQKISFWIQSLLNAFYAVKMRYIGWFVCNLYPIVSFHVDMHFYKGSFMNGDRWMIMITKTYILQCIWMLMDFKTTLANVLTLVFMLNRSGQMNSINHIVDAIPGSLQITTMTLFHQCGNCLLENFILIKPQIKPQLSWQFKSAYCGLRLSIGI